MQEIKGNNNLQVMGDLNIAPEKEQKNSPLTEYQWEIIKERVELTACDEYPIYQIYKALMAEFAVERTRDIPSHLYSEANFQLDKIEEKINKKIEENRDLKLKTTYIARIMQMPNLSEIQEYSRRKYATSYFHDLKTSEVNQILSYFEDLQKQVNLEPEPEVIQETLFSKLVAIVKKRVDL